MSFAGARAHARRGPWRTRGTSLTGVRQAPPILNATPVKGSSRASSELELHLSPWKTVCERARLPPDREQRAEVIGCAPLGTAAGSTSGRARLPRQLRQRGSGWPVRLSRRRAKDRLDGAR